MASKKGESISYVKHVPDFIAKMGLSQAQVREHQEKTAESKLEDKFAKKGGPS